MSKWLDFDEFKKEIEPLTTEDAVRKAKARVLEEYPNLSEKQKGAIARICVDKIDDILFGDEPAHWGKTIVHKDGETYELD